jgi:hypothetical protein
MQKIDDCKGIRLALTRAGVATRPEKFLQTFRLVVTAQYITLTTFYDVAPWGLLVSPCSLSVPTLLPFIASSLLKFACCLSLSSPGVSRVVRPIVVRVV